MTNPYITEQGYIFVPASNHPRALDNGCVSLHTLIAEKKIGRFLEPGEVVHHKDGNKLNNLPENLEVITRPEHISLHKRLPDVSNKEYLYQEYIILGKTKEQIAKANNCARQTVYKWLTHFGFSTMKRGESMQAYIRDLHNLGLSQTKIANALGLSQMTVSRRLKELLKKNESDR